MIELALIDLKPRIGCITNSTSMNIHRAIGLLKKKQPVFVCHPSIPPELSFVSGQTFAGATADLVVIEFDHYRLDPIGLTRFMRVITDATPTA